MQPAAEPLLDPSASVDVEIVPGMVLPVPDDAAAAAARHRLASIDIGISAPTVTALGMLTEAVVYIAGVQGSAYPRPLLSTRVVLLTGSHAGGLVAGPTPDPRNGLPLQHLAVAAGAGVVTLEWQPAAAAIELEDAITPEQMDAALRAGWDEAERAADEGIELLVLAAGGPGASTAAAAVVAAATGAEPTALLGRVVTPAGYYDDNAWMTRCLALRDSLHRVRDRHGDPRTVLAALGGADIAAATGLILGAASRKTPVMIDGPVGAAAALLANDFSAQSKRWVMLPDTGRQMTVRFAAEALGLRPWLDLCLDLGEGGAALAALPLLQTALTLAGVGEQVEPMPMSRFDSTGNQVFVGVARPVEPTDAADLDLIDAESELVPDPVSGRQAISVVGNPLVDDTAFVIYAARGSTSAGTAESADSSRGADATGGRPGRHGSRSKAAAARSAKPENKTDPKSDADAAPESKPDSRGEAMPVEAKPGEAKPVEAKPVEAKLVEAAAGEAKAGSGRTAAHKQVPARSAAKAAPAKPTRATPAKSTPAKAMPAKASTTRDTTRDLPARDLPTTDVPAKDVPAKDVPARAATDKDQADKDQADKDLADEHLADRHLADKHLADSDAAVSKAPVDDSPKDDPTKGDAAKGDAANGGGAQGDGANDPLTNGSGPAAGAAQPVGASLVGEAPLGGETERAVGAHAEAGAVAVVSTAPPKPRKRS